MEKSQGKSPFAWGKVGLFRFEVFMAELEKGEELFLFWFLRAARAVLVM